MTLRIEKPAVGPSYHINKYGLYRYSEYPRHSVLAGQTRREFLGTFETLVEAIKVAGTPDVEISINDS